MIDSAPSPALFVANDLALDFINSAYGPSTAPVDVLQGDQAAIDWLAEACSTTPDTGASPAG